MELQTNDLRPTRLRPPPRLDLPEVRVLVVEDDPAMRELLQEILEWDGYQVVAVAGTSEARLEIALAAHDTPDRMPAVVVTDRRMADGDGLDFIAELRSRWWWLPAVVVTAFADHDVYQRARMLGCCSVLSKPVQMDTVRSAVREAIRS